MNNLKHLTYYQIHFQFSSFYTFNYFTAISMGLGGITIGQFAEYGSSKCLHLNNIPLKRSLCLSKVNTQVFRSARSLSLRFKSSRMCSGSESQS